MANPVEWDNYILERSDVNDARYTMPALMTFKVSIEDTDFEGMQTFILNRRAINDRAVIYLHGRTLVDQPTIYHWKFLDTIARRTRAEVIVPLYPLAPDHTHEEAEAMLERRNAMRLIAVTAPKRTAGAAAAAMSALVAVLLTLLFLSAMGSASGRLPWIGNLGATCARASHTYSSWTSPQCGCHIRPSTDYALGDALSGVGSHGLCPRRGAGQGICSSRPPDVCNLK